MMLVNALSPVRAAEILRDLVIPGGTIAIMTSELGSIADAQDGWQLYAASKAALNMLMKKYAARHGADGHALLLVAPGWVRTEMGGRDATLSVEESIPRGRRRRGGQPGPARPALHRQVQQVPALVALSWGPVHTTPQMVGSPQVFGCRFADAHEAKGHGCTESAKLIRAHSARKRHSIKGVRGQQGFRSGPSPFPFDACR